MGMRYSTAAIVLSLACLAPTEPPPPWGQLVPRQPAAPYHRPERPTTRPVVKPKPMTPKTDQFAEDPDLIIRSREAEIRDLKQKVQDQQNELDSLNDKLIEAQNALDKLSKPT